MGLGLSFAPGEGPRSPPGARRSRRGGAGRARHGQAALRVRRRHVDPQGAERPRAADRLFGQPLDAGLLHGRRRGSDDYRLVKTMLYSRPDLMHRILAINADAVAAYLNAQIDAGAQAVMVFDSWGGVLADGAFQRFSLDYTRRVVVAQLQRERTASASRASSSPRAAACGWTRCRLRRRRGGPGLDRQPGPARAAVGARWRCKATSTPTCCSRRPRPWPARPWPCSTASAAAACRRRLGRPRLQPGPWHQPAHVSPEHVAAPALVEAVHQPFASRPRVSISDAGARHELRNVTC
jgi:hypothetical protein